jgi:UDP-glucose 4-epimerase
VKRVVIAGGAGFVGSALARLLVARGLDVVVVDDLRAGSAAPDDVTFVLDDIRTPDLVCDVVRRHAADTIVHLAAIHYIPYCDSHPNETIEINVQGTANVLDAVAVPTVERLLFASTAAVYRPALEPHDEVSSLGPIDIYGLTKVAGEAMVGHLASSSAVVCSVARLFNVYGPGDTTPHLLPDLVGQVTRQLGVVDRPIRVELGNLSTQRDYVHVTDVAAALVTLLDGPGGTFNVGHGQSWDAQSLLGTIEAIIQRPIEVSQAAGRLRRVDRPSLRADVSVIGALGWKPEMDIPTGLRQMITGRS